MDVKTSYDVNKLFLNYTYLSDDWLTGFPTNKVGQQMLQFSAELSRLDKTAKFLNFLSIISALSGFNKSSSSDHV